jgi:bifunctional UDP-N-acetylglucosamine pyrophosphorylase/glucosamine-1-phosphate N-acetyltransferase
VSASPLLPHILILAGGAGRRMKAAGPKALMPVFHRPMIHYVLDAALAIPHRSVSVVVGGDEQKVKDACRDYADVRWFRQESPLGTADAVRAAEPALAGQDGEALILNADLPLLTASALRRLLDAHAAGGAGATVAAEAEVCCFPIGELLAVLRRLAPSGAKPEFRLEDAAAALAAGGIKTAAFVFDDASEVLGVDDLYDLWRAESILRLRFNGELMRKGVVLRDPTSTWIDPRSRIEAGVVIEPDVVVSNSILEAGAYVESGCRIMESRIGGGSLLKQGTRVEASRVGRDCRLGPYAHLRPDSQLADEVSVGNFVEIKNAVIGARTKVSHLSYIGDANVGRNVNVGCGFITCNYDGGPLKLRTTIEDGVFIGSDSQAIAPVVLGAGSFIATGTSVTDDVPPGSFVISRGRQITKPGYAKKFGRSKAPAPRASEETRPQS